MTCSLEGCTRPRKTRGLCQTHYVRLWRTGSVEVEKTILRGSLLERLDSRTSRSSRCWMYQGVLNRAGYGVLNRGARGLGNVLAHRAAYELKVGPVTDGMFVCHRCDTPSCVRPSHLFLGTPRDNYLDMVSKGRQRPTVTHCPRGHEYTDWNTLWKKHGRRCRICNNAYERIRRAKKD